MSFTLIVIYNNLYNVCSVKCDCRSLDVTPNGCIACLPSHHGWRPSVMDMVFGSVAYLYACVCFMHACALLIFRIELQFSFGLYCCDV